MSKKTRRAKKEQAKQLKATQSANPEQAAAEPEAQPEPALETPAEESKERNEEPDGKTDEPVKEGEVAPSAEAELEGHGDNPDEPLATSADAEEEAAAEPSSEGEAAEEPAAEEAKAKPKGMPPEKARQVVEAVLFAADQPLALARLAQILGRTFNAGDARKIVDELNAEYLAQGRAFEIVEIAGGLQFMTRPEFKNWVAEAHKHRKQEKLSPSAVETLAIVAYKQPILRAQVDDIRGVQCGPLLRSLLERGLIKAVGRQNVPGRPILYGTSRIFLQHFGLKSLKDMPRVAELTPP